MRRALLIVCVLAVTSPVFAQSDAAAAEVLYNEAIEAKSKRDLAAACPKFAESYRLDPVAPTLVMVAECEVRDGRIADAWGHLQEALAKLRDTRQIAHAKKLSASLEKRVPRLTVKLAAGATDAMVKRDGVELRSASLGTALPVNPGDHTIVVSAIGRKDATFRVEAREGATAEITVSVGDPAPIEETEARQREPDVHRESSQSDPPRGSAGDGSGQRTLGWIATGVGIAGVGAGAYFSLRAKTKDDDARSAGCSEATCPTDGGITATNESRSAGQIATVAWIVGGAAVIGGVVLVLTAPNATTQAHVRISPALGWQSNGLVLGGAW